MTLIGGGARSEYWRQMLYLILAGYNDYRTLAAMWGQRWVLARLAQVRWAKQTPLADVLPQLPLEQARIPDVRRHAVYQQRRETTSVDISMLPLMS